MKNILWKITQKSKNFLSADNKSFALILKRNKSQLMFSLGTLIRDSIYWALMQWSTLLFFSIFSFIPLFFPLWFFLPLSSLHLSNLLRYILFMKCWQNTMSYTAFPSNELPTCVRLCVCFGVHARRSDMQRCPRFRCFQIQYPGSMLHNTEICSYFYLLIYSHSRLSPTAFPALQTLTISNTTFIAELTCWI